MQKITLKPCPFCGKEVTQFAIRIYCGNCSYFFGDHYSDGIKERAAERWNKRIDTNAKDN